jgi:Ca-activated chloride channel family protein
LKLSAEEREAILKELDKYFDMDKISREDKGLLENLVNAFSGKGTYNAPAMEAAFPDGGYYEAEEPSGFPEGDPSECPPGWPLIYFREFNTEEYAYYPENGFNSVFKAPLSTFAADVDTGSYTNLRRYIREGSGIQSIPAGLLRYEEMINYFDYQITSRSEGRFSLGYRLAECPWNPAHKLLMMTVKANEVKVEEKPGNYVFLIDVSGSMAMPEKIELAVKSFALFTKTLGEKDMVSVVTYSGTSETLLDSCPTRDTEKILEALKKAETYCVTWGGGTNGSGGITAAYELAEKNLVKGGNNRVIIASDGDMNLGITGTAGLVELITKEKEKGIFLTTLGFGTGNYSDTNMEQIADAGNGNYYYIDCIDEAQRVLVEKARQTTVTVAKDVKFQMEFNPARVSEYKLIGYENRVMSADDFEDDTKDGGEVGAGQAVTVLYEIVPASGDGKDSAGLKYQDVKLSERAESGEIGTLAIRYKEPDGEKSVLEEQPLKDDADGLGETEFGFAAAVAMASLVINQSAYMSESTLEKAIALAEQNAGENDYRKAFVSLMRELQDNTEWEAVKVPEIPDPHAPTDD